MITNPSYNIATAITASDTVDITLLGTDAIYVGGAGVVPVVFLDGSVVNFTCIAGQVLPVKARRINATNLTATTLVALYRV